MKRSSSKLISKASSVRNINKVGFKFRFEIQVESLDKLISANEVVVAWQRGAKVLTTPPVPVDKNRVANFNNHSLSQDITLFKKKKEGAEFEDKVFKLLARAGSETGKIIARIEINFADYVEIPSFTKRVSAAMSNGGRLIMRVSSTFLGEAKARKGSRGTNSIGSSAFAGSDAGSLVDENDAKLDQLNAFDDLDIDDAPAPAPAPNPTPPITSNAKISSSYGLSNNLHNPPLTSSSSSSFAQQQQQQQQQQPSRRPSATRRPSASSADEHSSGSLRGNPRRNVGGGTSPRAPDDGHARAASPSMRPRPPAHRIDSDLGVTSGGGGAGAPSRAEFDRMGKEARSLRRANEDLMARNNDLERRLEGMSVGSGGGGFGDSEENDRLARENKKLRLYVEDLEGQLRREPVYADVVRDLREAKMALAILTLEKDELTQEIRRLRR